MRQDILTRFPRLQELMGVVFLFAAIGFVVALATYDPGDPSLNTATALHPPENAIGVIGSHLADLCFQCVGFAAWALPLILGMVGYQWLRRREVRSPLERVVGYSVMMAALAAGAAIVAPFQDAAQGYATGGVAGHLLATTLTASLNVTGSLLLLAALLVISLYLVSTFSLSSAGDAMEGWLLSHFQHWRRRKRDTGEKTELGLATSSYASSEPVAHYNLQDNRSPGLAAAAAAAGPGSAHGGFAGQDHREEYAYAGGLGALPIRDQVMAQEAAAYLHRGGGAAVDDVPPWEETPAAGDEEIPIHAFEEPEPEAAITPPPPEPRKAKRQSEPTLPTCFQLPPTKLLSPPAGREAYDSFELKEIAGRIKEKLEEFNVRGNVVQINPGPVVTTFEFKPDAGVKIAKITTLSEDLCLGLQAESILIERIPGKPTVGIEVPNTRRETISLRQVLESAEFQEASSRLTIAMGKDISGRIRISELEKMPHLLIAGSTGSGKSVMLNTLIMSVIYKSTPEEVRMIMVDPKRVELGIYDGIPHLLTPVITEPKKAVNALRNAVLEMERRLKLLASYGVRNIDQFNRKIQKLRERPLELFVDDAGPDVAEPEKPLPYILIVIDELADLMMLERAGVEESVIRLAQMARAVGIHLVLATQRPSVDVITGLIKANFPARISFRVATRVDSRTVLDVMGAEHLLGRGDMLFLPPGSSRLIRVHGAFVTETEITEVVDYWRNQAAPDYDQSYLIAPPSDEDEPAEEFDGDEDPMYRDAVKVVLEMGKASTSILQRRLRLGYGRAARILDMMQRDGVIGPPDGSRPREVLRRPDWLDEVETALR
ncbi:MAG TPA: DNA translocase FtsK [Bryobacteraceae bacterium]|nr:cell division protein FtsK [Bryobacterales bacterium]HRJ20066.1 DNA translocase FtsK [Bryobacteraceae bacterium]